MPFFARRKDTSGLLRNRSFRLLFSAHALASLGEWFDAIAIQVLVVYRWGADPMMIALIPVVMALPGLLLSSLAGTLADRLPQARLMMLSDLAAACLTLAVLFAPGVAWLLPLLALRACASVFQLPAQQGLTRVIVPSDQLLQAASWNGLVGQGSKVAGPLLGAMLLVLLSPQLCIALNAVTRLCSAALLWPLRGLSSKQVVAPSGVTTLNVDGRQRQEQGQEREQPQVQEGAEAQEQSFGEGACSQEQEQGTHREVALDADTMAEQNEKGFLAQWREGWAYIVRTKRLLHTLIFGLFGIMAILMIDYQFATLLRTIYPGDESLVGWLISAIGIGAVAVIMVLNRMNHIGAGWGLGGGYLCIGGAIAVLGVLPPGSPIWLLLVAGVLIGLGNGLYMVTQNYILQSETPAHLVGRIFGIQNTVLGAVMIGAPLAGGVLIQMAGPGLSFLAIGSVVGLLGVSGMLLQSMIWGHEPKTDAGRYVERGEL
ncbi:MFS transporter [Paenibacillus massiliensis]|uniref:MFS transporter n=1 Tax=Paenibacillus massiliensis TaxID=225917 RepID=UPI0004728896|nr:MFS transporter [Paenibacillus massiliensis]